jgi:nucleoside-diphosphate-sugar epimerase
MRLLVIGGTVFVGRAVVEAALRRGDAVTVFHRGQHGRGLFGDRVETILGDRGADLERLRGREWDVVVDTCGFDPEAVGASARALADSVERYVFVSSAGVYRDWPVRPVAGEDAPRHERGDDYSASKAACERALEAVVGERAVLVRPGVIVGPHENIGRLPWWLARMARGGDVLAPGPPEAPIQLIDARDLAAFALDAPPGAYNAISAPGAWTWGELLRLAREVTGGAARLVWVDGERLAPLLDEPWDQLPMWPAPQADMAAVYGVGADRAVAAGLRLRPLADTVRDTWAWLSAPGAALDDWRSELRAGGLAPERERELLAAL